LFARSIFQQSGGSAAARVLLDRPDPPDALLVANAQMGLGVLAEIRSRKLWIGRDLGIVVFDDAPWAPLITPPMTVVAQPAYDIGTNAAQLLFDRIRTGSGRADDGRTAQRLVLPISLIVRESSRKAGRQ
jgi:LacI family transcriptional regulator